MFHASETVHLPWKYGLKEKQKRKRCIFSLLIDESDHGILWLFVAGTLWYQTAGGKGLMGGLFVMSPSRRHSSRLPAFFMPQKRQIHLLRLETGPDTLLGLTQAAPAL